MIKLLFLSLLILSIGSCNKTIPESTIRSLSGKDYAGANSGLYSASDISLVKDFLVSGHGISIKEHVELPSGDGFIFTIENGDHPNGEELFIYDEATRKWSLLLDLMPEKFEGSRPMGLKIANDHLYFTANTGSGRELYKYNLSSDVHTKLTDINNGDPQILETNKKLPFEVYIDGSSTVRVYTMFEDSSSNYVLRYFEDTTSAPIVYLEYNDSVSKKIKDVGKLIMGDNNFYVYHENDDGTMQITKFDYDPPSPNPPKMALSFVVNDIANGKNKWVITPLNLFYIDDSSNLNIIGSMSFSPIAGAFEVIFFNNALYSVNGSGNLVKDPFSASPIIFDFTGAAGDSKVKNLTVSNGHLCFSAVPSTIDNDRKLYCSSNTNPSGTGHFESYDFDTISDSEREVGNIIATDSGIAVAAADSNGSSVFHIGLTNGNPPNLTIQTQLLPYREKLYGYIEQNYNRFFSVGNTIVTTNLFDVVNSYHGPLTGLSSSLQDDFIDNAIAGENGSSLVIVKFAYGNKLFGNFVGNTNEFWSLDLSSKQVSLHPQGAIQSELYPHGGKIYFAVKYRGFDELVEFDPASNTGVHLHPCGVNEATNLADWCHPGGFLGAIPVRGEIKIHGIYENHLFYTALTHASSTDDLQGFELFGIDLSGAAPADAKMYSYEGVGSNSVDNITFMGIHNSSTDVYFYSATSGKINYNILNLPTIGSPTEFNTGFNFDKHYIAQDKIYLFNSADSIFAIWDTLDHQLIAEGALSGITGFDTVMSGEVAYDMHVINNEVYFSSSSKIVKAVAGSDPINLEAYYLSSFSSSNLPQLFNNILYYTDNDGGVRAVSPVTNQIIANYPNVLNSSGLDCNPGKFEIFDINQNMISFYCEDLITYLPSVVVYSISEQKSYFLYNYGIIYDPTTNADNIKTIYSDQDKAIFYSTQYSQIGVFGPYEFSTGKLFEINLKSGLINYLGIDYEEVLSFELGFGKYYTCANGHLSLYNFNLSNEPFSPENAICAEEIAGISIVPYIYDQKAYLPLFLSSPSSPDIGLELYQIEI